MRGTGSIKIPGCGFETEFTPYEASNIITLPDITRDPISRKLT